MPKAINKFDQVAIKTITLINKNNKFIILFIFTSNDDGPLQHKCQPIAQAAIAQIVRTLETFATNCIFLFLTLSAFFEI
jgi:hypothetical protein